MAIIKAQIEPSTPNEYYWDTEKRSLFIKEGDKFVPVPTECKSCNKLQCSCGEQYRTDTIPEVVNKILPMLIFKTNEEVRDIIRKIEARCILGPTYGGN